MDEKLKELISKCIRSLPKPDPDIEPIEVNWPEGTVFLSDKKTLKEADGEV